MLKLQGRDMERAEEFKTGDLFKTGFETSIHPAHGHIYPAHLLLSLWSLVASTEVPVGLI